MLYKSFWRSILLNSRRGLISGSYQQLYFSAKPNPGAGIGHQMANWIAGFWFARLFGLKFAHTAFSDPAWEEFLGFGIEEVTVNQLVQEQGYKKVLLPLFNEQVLAELELIRKIIKSYSGKKVVFIAEQDQFYRDQFGVMEDIKRKFNEAPARKNDLLLYNPAHFNIAIHVRRGDIMTGMVDRNPNLLMRYQANDYFEAVLKNVLKSFHFNKPVRIFLFSQGEEADFASFKKNGDIRLCLDMPPMECFLHMAKADLLITSKSSFSYKPALLSMGIRICPRDFWHGYPYSEDWITADQNGDFDDVVI